MTDSIKFFGYTPEENRLHKSKNINWVKRTLIHVRVFKEWYIYVYIYLFERLACKSSCKVFLGYHYCLLQYLHGQGKVIHWIYEGTFIQVVETFWKWKEKQDMLHKLQLAIWRSKYWDNAKEGSTLCDPTHMTLLLKL